MQAASSYVRSELVRLDLLLQREILRLRGRYQLSLDELRGLYISHQQVDDLLRRSPAEFDPLALTVAADRVHAANRAALAEGAEWTALTATFALESAEQDLLLLALAPEVDPKYEALFAYLNNDVTRKYATRDLAIRLLPMHEEAELRGLLVADSRLYREGLLRRVGAGFCGAPAFTRCVLCPGAVPVSPLRRDTAAAAAATNARWTRVAPLAAPGKVLVFAGHDGDAALEAGGAIAAGSGRPLLLLDARDLLHLPEPIDDAIADITVQCRMERAILFIRHGGTWLADGEPPAAAARLLRALARVPVIFTCGEHARYRRLLPDRETVRFTFDAAPFDRRRTEWVQSTRAGGLAVDGATIDDLAHRFALTPRQIGAAARGAADARTVAGADGNPRPWLFEAARAQCGDALAQLAGKVASPFRWPDLIVPAAVAEQLRAVAGAIANRHIVYEDWGMATRVDARGLNVLFSGPSGTGKTMSAGVIAAEIGLDLYRIDLSSLVSKYIGETEKNLDRVFAAARASNAILLFDEADALFGKRSDVKDAHDRYANIEVAYLLQKMEDHDGAVILATNLAANMDESFGRRMQFVVDFPLPDAEERRRLWRHMFPPRAPLDAEVDLAFLAEHFHLSGGQIRSISLDAAFLAAQNGRVITMRHLVHAVGRHLVREGRLPSATDFQHHFPLLMAGA